MVDCVERYAALGARNVHRADDTSGWDTAAMARPPLSNPQTWVEVHLAYELESLLVASTTWSSARSFADRRDWPPYLVTLSQDSALLHARALYELFGSSKSRWREARRSIGLSAPITSALFDEYERGINDKLHHVSTSRPFVPETFPHDELPDRVLDFAHDVLSIWDGVSVQPETSACHDAFRLARARAIAAATETAEWFGAKPEFI